MKHPMAAGGNMLIVTDTRAEVVAKFIVAGTEALCRGEAPEPAHTSDAAFDAPVIRLKPVVLEDGDTMGDPPAQGRADRSWRRL